MTMHPDLSVTEKMLLSLLKISFNGKNDDESVFEKATPEIWEDCYNLSIKQGVMALAWDGIALLSEQVLPPKKIKIKWGYHVEKYEKRYQYYCKTVHELFEFYKSHGIAAVQLKGVGMSSYYPIPAHREGGDIDIYTFSEDRKSCSDTESNRKADRLMEDQGTEVDYKNKKHSLFLYKNIRIENHKFFLNTNTYKGLDNAERFIENNIGKKEVLLCNKYRINIPSDDVNKLFTICHAMQHFASGLSLHHLYDWACLIKNCGTDLPISTENKEIHRFANALSLLCSRLFDIQVNVSANEELSAKILHEAFNPYEYDGKCPYNKLAIIAYKIKRSRSYYNYKRDILKARWYRNMANTLISKICKPSTIPRIWKRN